MLEFSTICNQNVAFKGMDFIDLPSIFQDKSVTSSIPDYFQILSITNLSDTQSSTSISLCLILISMLIHLVHEIVKILNLYTHQPAMLSLEI